MYEHRGYCNDQFNFFGNNTMQSFVYFNKQTKHFTYTINLSNICKDPSSYIMCDDNIDMFLAFVGNCRKNNGYALWTNKITGEVYRGQQFGVDWRRSNTEEIKNYYAKVKNEKDRKEKEESSKCAFCGNKENFSKWLHLYMDGNKLHISYEAYSCDSSFDETITLNYCPICGRKL